MPLEVLTRDAIALSDTELDEMAAMGGAFDIGALSKAVENWVLVTTARNRGRLDGFSFTTLERIGGTPCVLLGLVSVRRDPKRETTLRGLMREAYHRALMAFPDEDVVVGSRFVDAGALIAFRDLDEVKPDPASPAVGEERAWGRRLAKRFGVDAHYDEKSFIVARNGHDGFFDFETLKPESVSNDMAKMFTSIDVAAGGCMIVFGWTMAEDLVKLGRR